MRLAIGLATVLVLVVGGCKKGSTTKAVEDAVQSAANAAAAAAEPPTCPECQACPPAPPPCECPKCPECPDPAALGKVELGAAASPLKVLPPAGFTFTVEKGGEYQIDATAAENDPIIRLFKDAEQLGADDDSGGEKNARLYAFLAPGTYTVRVAEVSWLPLEAQVQVAPAPAFTPTGALALGEELEVELPEAENPRDAMREFTLEVAEAGNYRIDAVVDAEFDSYLRLIRDGAQVAEDDDGGDDHNARIEMALEPGSYVVRVYDLQARAVTAKLTAAKVE